MKKLLTICLFIVTTFVSQAQDTKPTKEQTIAFIKDYYNNIGANNMAIRKVDDKSITIKGYEDVQIEFSSNNSIMTMNFIFTYKYHNIIDNLKNNYKVKSKIIIDLSKIEKISFYNALGITGATEIIPRIQFKATTNAVIQEYESDKNLNFPDNPQNVTNVLIPIESCDDCNIAEDNKKILQAFNHLRKLCGAPEPISFED